MSQRNNAATVYVGSSKYEIEADAIVDISLKNGGSYKSLRVTGVSRMGDCLRCVSTSDGIIEVPLNSIEKIVDAGKNDFSGVTVTTRR